MKENPKIEILMSELYRFYTETAEARSMEYTYGFFDALGVIKDILQKL